MRVTVSGFKCCDSAACCNSHPATACTEAFVVRCPVRIGEMRGHRILLRLAIAVYACALLTIHIDDGWRLLHEDNGAMQTTFALSHLRYGLNATRGHNVFINPRTGSRTFYVHHPPAVPWVLAAAFAATGRQSPLVARGAILPFSVATLLLMMGLLTMFFADELLVAVGGLAMATFPMAVFFGRMVNYEPPTLFFCVVQVWAYLRYRKTQAGSALAFLGAAIVMGGLFDWASLSFCAAIAAAALYDRVREGQSGALLTTVLAAGAVTTLNVWHVNFATGSLGGFMEAVTNDVGAGHDPLTPGGFVLAEIENFREYFTISGFVAVAVVSVALVCPRSRLAVALFREQDDNDLPRFLGITLAAAVLWQLSSPSHARIHHYWQYYFLPFAITSFVLMIRWVRSRQPRMAVILLAIIGLEVIASSSYRLYRRFTTESAWVVESTRRMEADYLTPKKSEE
jgi:hypothetical protein